MVSVFRLDVDSIIFYRTMIAPISAMTSQRGMELDIFCSELAQGSRLLWRECSVSSPSTDVLRVSFLQQLD